ncbi:hypothetical protein UMZ34_08745 [Halopseudomonas pachastrellae]|nr:hypothetical protein UMZ34_08745 [Halopseudomonas pachastrellae]
MRVDNLILLVLAAIALFALYRAYGKARRARRERLIDTYRFPESIAAKVGKTYPHLSDAEVTRVMQGLREYFHLCNTAGRRMVSMPSQAVDVAWHEFILFTRKYECFCGKALGRFLHHTRPKPCALPPAPRPASRPPGACRACVRACNRVQRTACRCCLPLMHS